MAFNQGMSHRSGWLKIEHSGRFHIGSTVEAADNSRPGSYNTSLSWCPAQAKIT